MLLAEFPFGRIPLKANHVLLPAQILSQDCRTQISEKVGKCPPPPHPPTTLSASKSEWLILGSDRSLRVRPHCQALTCPPSCPPPPSTSANHFQLLILQNVFAFKAQLAHHKKGSCFAEQHSNDITRFKIVINRFPIYTMYYFKYFTMNNSTSYVAPLLEKQNEEEEGLTVSSSQA